MTISSSAAPAARPTGLWAALLCRVAQRARRGEITVVLPDGRSRRIEGEREGPSAVVHVSSPRLLWRLWSGGDMGFAQAYIDGDCDTPDLEALLHWALANEGELAPALETGPWVRLAALMHRLRPNTRAG